MFWSTTQQKQQQQQQQQLAYWKSFDPTSKPDNIAPSRLVLFLFPALSLSLSITKSKVQQSEELEGTWKNKQRQHELGRSELYLISCIISRLLQLLNSEKVVFEAARVSTIASHNLTFVVVFSIVRVFFQKLSETFSLLSLSLSCPLPCCCLFTHPLVVF